MNKLAEQYIRKEALPLIFCPGCGDGIILNTFIRAIHDMGIRKDLACVSGIGCSSWLPVYLDVDVLHTIHGRAIPFAEGLKVSRPDKKIVVFTGDGDGIGIGGNHLIHAARRNIDITVIMMTNNIYGMTGGQKAPTTPKNSITKTSPLGNDERPFDVYSLVVGAGATFFARWTAGNPVQLQKTLKDAINHKGFSFIEVLSQCPTQAGRNIFNTNDPYKMIKWYKDNTYILKKGQNAEIKDGKLPLGILYVEDEVDEYTDIMQKMKEGAQCK